jgi:hypothetical protein
VINSPDLQVTQPEHHNDSEEEPPVLAEHKLEGQVPHSTLLRKIIVSLTVMVCECHLNWHGMDVVRLSAC